MTNTAHIVETALLLLAAYLLGCLVGYAARRVLHAGRGTRQITVAPDVVATTPLPAEARRPRTPAARLAASVEDLPPPHPVVIPAAAEKPAGARQPARLVAAGKSSAKPKSADPKPATLAAPRPGGADNLKQIKGIGPKIEASLHGLGIFHIDQIASWSRANIDWVDTQLAFKGRIRRERWVEQAAELSKTRASA